MPSIIVLWPKAIMVDFTGMTAETECSLLNYHVIDGIEGQPDRMASDMEVQMKQRCETEFIHAEKMAPTDIHRHLLSVYRDQTVDGSTVKW